MILRYHLLSFRYHPLSWLWPIAQSNNVRLHRNERSESMRTGNNNISCEMCFMQRWIHAGMMVSLYNSKGFGEELRLIGFDSCFTSDCRISAPMSGTWGSLDENYSHPWSHAIQSKSIFPITLTQLFPGFLRSSWHDGISGPFGDYRAVYNIRNECVLRFLIFRCSVSDIHVHSLLHHLEKSFQSKLIVTI